MRIGIAGHGRPGRPPEPRLLGGVIYLDWQGPQEDVMAHFGLLHYAIVFLVVALLAAAVGFGGIAGVAMEGARLLFWVFIVLFVLSLVAGLIRRT
jgi:uncharacterized membrane protein YtjA (UPF0391 family)